MSSHRRKAWAFTDARHSVAAGVVLTAIGSYLLYEGYDRRGRTRPWLMRFLPGP